jgi:hypothetical protein
VAGRTGSGGGEFAFADWLMGIENGRGGFLHFASTLFMPGFCQFCMLLPRGNEDEVLCAEPTAAAQTTTTTSALGAFIT